jgi:hypothetical protein
MQTEIPLYQADGELCDWITPARLARLEKLDLIQIVRHKKGHVSRCVLRPIFLQVVTDCLAR